MPTHQSVIDAGREVGPDLNHPAGSRETDCSDLALLERIRSGDTSALDYLLRRYWTPLVSYAARVLESWDSAQDVAQETFVRVWERRESWRVDGSVRGLLYRITRNLAFDELKRRARGDQWVDEQRHGSPRLAVTPEEEFQGHEFESALSSALNSLPARRREIFVLARLEGLSRSEIADVLGIAPQTVANLLTLALAHLRTALEPFLITSDTPNRAKQFRPQKSVSAYRKSQCRSASGQLPAPPCE